MISYPLFVSALSLLAFGSVRGARMKLANEIVLNSSASTDAVVAHKVVARVASMLNVSLAVDDKVAKKPWSFFDGVWHYGGTFRYLLRTDGNDLEFEEDHEDGSFVQGKLSNDGKDDWYFGVLNDGYGSTKGYIKIKRQGDSLVSRFRPVTNGKIGSYGPETIAQKSYAQCVDRKSDCEGWGKKGYCIREYVDFMKQNCPKTCRLCSCGHCPDISKDGYLTGFNGHTVMNSHAPDQCIMNGFVSTLGAGQCVPQAKHNDALSNYCYCNAEGSQHANCGCAKITGKAACNQESWCSWFEKSNMEVKMLSKGKNQWCKGGKWRGQMSLKACAEATVRDTIYKGMQCSTRVLAHSSKNNNCLCVPVKPYCDLQSYSGSNVYAVMIDGWAPDIPDSIPSSDKNWCYVNCYRSSSPRYCCVQGGATVDYKKVCSKYPRANMRCVK